MEEVLEANVKSINVLFPAAIAFSFQYHFEAILFSCDCLKFSFPTRDKCNVDNGLIGNFVNQFARVCSNSVLNLVY